MAITGCSSIYATIASPFIDFLKKDCFQWSDISQTTFLQLKKAIASAPVLQLPDFQQPFILETDDFGIGIGLVLSQNKHLIAYFSKKLTPDMQRQSDYVRELFVVTE